MEAIGYFLFGMLLLLLGGDSVVRGVSGLGQRVGLSPFLAGLLLVSFATSLPTLAVSAYALRTDHVQLALGNALGGSVAHLGLVLALAALMAPQSANLRMLVAELVFALVAAGAVLFFGMDGALSAVEGIVLLAGYGAFLGFVVARAGAESNDVRQEFEKYAHTGTSVAQNLARLAIGAFVLYWGSRHVVGQAPVLGEALGLGEFSTGLTLVALATSVPLLVPSLLSMRMGQGNVVAGQALGASLFNLLLVVGGVAAVHPVAIPAGSLAIPLLATMALSLILYPSVSGGKRLDRGVGGLLLAVFAGWMIFTLAPAWR